MSGFFFGVRFFDQGRTCENFDFFGGNPLFDDACINGFFFVPLEAKGGVIRSFFEKMHYFHGFGRITPPSASSGTKKKPLMQKKQYPVKQWTRPTLKYLNKQRFLATMGRLFDSDDDYCLNKQRLWDD